MSVTGDIDVAYRRFSGYLDPRYPEGQWLGSVTVSGDGSGGTLTGSIIFARATESRLNSRIYSLEEIGASISGTDTQDQIRISTDNLGRDGPAAFQHRFVLLLSEGGTGTIQIFPRDLALLPILLGAMRVPLVNTRILATMINPGVGDDFRFEAAGYWWGSRSVLVDGGPQRPPQGIYPA